MGAGPGAQADVAEHATRGPAVAPESLPLAKRTRPNRPDLKQLISQIESRMNSIRSFLSDRGGHKRDDLTD